jgi:hypothetical protein
MKECLRCCCWFLLFTAPSICWAGSHEQDEARLLQLVPLQIDALARAAPECSTPGVHFSRADFDGDRSFRYVVASYFAACGSHITSAVRVLKESAGKLLLYQIPEGLSLCPGVNVTPEVVDLENDGQPELAFRVSRGTNSRGEYSLLVFRWKEDKLQRVPGRGIDTRKAIFLDLNADGRLELVGFPRCLASKSAQDNTSYLHTGSGHRKSSRVCTDRRTYFYRDGEFKEIEVRRSEAKLSLLAASDKEFSLAESDPPQNLPTDRKEFVVRLGWSYNPSGSNSSKDIRPETLLLGRSLRPLAVITKLQKDDQDCKERAPSVRCFEGELVEARFDWKSVAGVLPKLQLQKKLEPGDTVALPFAALMANGDYVSTDITLTISK